MKKTGIKKRKKQAYIKPDDKVVSIVKFINNFEDANQAFPRYYSTAIGSISKTSFTDKLVSPPKTYKLYEGLDEARKALEDGELKVGEAYCCSFYEYNNIFPELGMKATKEEAILYLKAINESGLNAFAWTFLDADELEKLNNKIAQSKRYC